MVLAHCPFHWWCQWCLLTISIEIQNKILSTFLFRRLTNVFIFSNNQFFCSALTNLSFQEFVPAWTCWRVFFRFKSTDVSRLKSAEECLPGLKVPICGELRLKSAKGCLSGLKAPTCSLFSIFSSLTNHCHNSSVPMHQKLYIAKELQYKPSSSFG